MVVGSISTRGIDFIYFKSTALNYPKNEERSVLTLGFLYLPFYGEKKWRCDLLLNNIRSLSV